MAQDGIVQDLMEQFGRLPGIGPKGAQRIAYHLLEADIEQLEKLAGVIGEVKIRTKFCVLCGNIAEGDRCPICMDDERDLTTICVVEEWKDIVAMERMHEYHGVYHVLGGALSPIDGIGPDNLRIRELLARLADGRVKELILAMDPNLEGDATASYLARLVAETEIVVTKLASGLPVGGDLEYADEVTLGRAFEGRRPISGNGSR